MSNDLDVLYALGCQLRDEPLKADLAQDVLEILEQGMGYELLAILAVDESDGDLRPAALSRQGNAPSFLEEDRAYVKSRSSPKGLTSWVARTGRPVRVDDVMEDPRYFGIRDDIRSELCVPLLVGSEVVGVLNTETTDRSAYSKADERFLETAASHIALALKFHREQGVRFGEGQGKEAALLLSCSYCARVRTSGHQWVRQEAYLKDEYGLLLSHGICPTCYMGIS